MDIDIPGGVRTKNWDVVWVYDKKCRLAISLKSILRNVAGTVPNRLDDLMGEVTNAQMYSPELVIGYIMVFDVSQDSESKKHGSTWRDLLRDRLKGLSVRTSPSWGFGTIEAAEMIEVDFSSTPELLTPETEMARLFDTLVAEVIKRNPALEGQ